MNTVVEQFSKSAPFYDQHAYAQRYAFDQLLSRVQQHFSAELPLNVLDVGCGTGFHTALFSHAFPQSKCTGQDIAADMIQWASQHYQSQRLQFELKTIDQIEATPQRDLILSSAAFQWFHHLSDELVSLKKCLKPNGRLYFSAFGPQTYQELKHILSMVMGKPAVLASSGFLTAAQTEQACAQHFRYVTVEQEQLKRSYSSVHELLRTIKRTGTRGEGLQGVQWTPGFLKDVDATYRSLYGQILVTYDMMFGVAYDH